MNKQKIIIWGYPLYSHTHSYTHEAFYKGFKYLGYDTYWFDDKNFPSDFDFTNCVFWTEGFADENIPLNDSSTYFVHVAKNPKKYLDAGVKRFIDVRNNTVWISDHVYTYTMDKDKLQKVGPCCYYEPKTSEKIQFKNHYHEYETDDYDKFYISWAANALPEEFNFNDVYLPRENKIYFLGNLSPIGVCENRSNFDPFINECRNNGVLFFHNDPWGNPLPNEQIIELTKKSVLGVDIRGKEHIKNGYIPCRIFKNISYGHLGMTNSKAVYDELEGHCIFNENTAQLYYDAMNKKNDYEFIKSAMKYVKENHTFVSRIKSIMSIL